MEEGQGRFSKYFLNMIISTPFFLLHLLEINLNLNLCIDPLGKVISIDAGKTALSIYLLVHYQYSSVRMNAFISRAVTARDTKFDIKIPTYYMQIKVSFNFR